MKSSGPKGRSYSAAFAARLKPCPDTKHLRFDPRLRFSAGAKQAAEKDVFSTATSKKHTSGPQGRIDFAGSVVGVKTPTYQSRPTARTSFSATCKGRSYSAAFAARLKPCPDTKHLRFDPRLRFSAGAKQAAEKGVFSTATSKKHTSGPKGRIDFAGSVVGVKTPTYQSRPTARTSFSATCKGRPYSAAFAARLKPCPDTKHLRFDPRLRFSAGAKQAAEKVVFSTATSKKHTSGPKGRIDFAGSVVGVKTPTYQSLPTARTSFSATCKGRSHSAATAARLKPCPEKKEEPEEGRLRFEVSHPSTVRLSMDGAPGLCGRTGVPFLAPWVGNAGGRLIQSVRVLIRD